MQHDGSFGQVTFLGFVDPGEQLPQHRGRLAPAGRPHGYADECACERTERQGLQGGLGSGAACWRPGSSQVIPAQVGLDGGLGQVCLPLRQILPVIDQVPGRRGDLEVPVLHGFAGKLLEHHALLHCRRRRIGLHRLRTGQRAQNSEGQCARVFLRSSRLEQPQQRMRDHRVTPDQLVDAMQGEETPKPSPEALRKLLVVDATMVREPGELVHARLAGLVHRIVEGAALEQLLLHDGRTQHLQHPTARRRGLGFQTRQCRAQFFRRDIESQQPRLHQAQRIERGLAPGGEPEACADTRLALVTLVDLDHHFASGDLARRSDMHRPHRPGHGRVDDGFHLHRLERQDAHTGAHPVARLDMNLRHRCRQFGAHTPVRHPAEAVGNALDLDIDLRGRRGALHGVTPAAKVQQQRALAGGLCPHHRLPFAAAHAQLVRPD